MSFPEDVNWNSPNGRVYSESGVESKTKQSDALNSDVNAIIARHVAHKIPLPENSRAIFGDFSDIGSYHDCYGRVQRMEENFLKLPADLRKMCDNDPGMLLEMLQSPSDEARKRLEEVGLLAPVKPENGAGAPIVDEAVGNGGPTS